MSTTTSRLAPVTVRDALVNALRGATEYNPADVEGPVAILWPDVDREWEPVVRHLSASLPMFRLGVYEESAKSGPAAFLRIAVTEESPVAGALPPVLYLPGVSRRQLVDLESLDDSLKPLASLVVRSTLFAQRNANDWTPFAFFTNAGVGLGLEVSGDARTKSALERALPRLMDHDIADLRGRRLDADALNAVVVDDPVWNILRWLSEPDAYRAQADEAGVWSGFVALVGGKYGVNPEKDGPLAAGARMGDRQGNWAAVWDRFSQAPAAYPGLPELLRRAKPDGVIPLHTDSWPQDNEEAEAAAFTGLNRLVGRPVADVRDGIRRLVTTHRPRLGGVWAQFGRTPGALAVSALADLADATTTMGTGSTVGELADHYATTGWKADDAFIRVLGSLEAGHPELPAVTRVGESLYRPWLDAVVGSFQATWSGRGQDDGRSQAVDEPLGTCVVFVDGLRLDVARVLADVLERRGQQCELEWRLAGVPTVTSTCKPAVSPVASKFGSCSELAPRALGGAAYSQDQLKRALTENGWQFIPQDADGDPVGRGWTEGGDIDNLGHALGARLAHHLPAQVETLARRVGELLAAGWSRVVFVTDHGWLLLPSKLPKQHLPEHLTVVRKGRCARLKAEVNAPDGLTVLPWHWDPAVDIVVAPGLHAFEEGKVYEHGGLSPQESVVPRLVVTSGAGDTGRGSRTIDFSWVGLTLRVDCDWVPEGARVDIRTRAADSATSLVSRPKEMRGGKARLIADDEHAGEMAFVVVLDSADHPLAQQSTSIPEA